jgi:DNA-binding transcriptional MerR regulator
MKKEKHSISETARLLGVHRGTLRRWIEKALIPEPIAEDVAGSRLRYWTAEGFTEIKEYKRKHFREGQGRRQRKQKETK